MADKTVSETLGEKLPRRYVDMGDGTFAEVYAGGAGTAGSTAGGVQTVQKPEDGVALTKSPITMTGASVANNLVAASAGRKIVIVSSTDTNAPAAVDITGGTAALDSGIPLLPGTTIKITGKAAQSAMTQIGTNGQKLTVFTG